MTPRLHHHVTTASSSCFVDDNDVIITGNLIWKLQVSTLGCWQVGGCRLLASMPLPINPTVQVLFPPLTFLKPMFEQTIRGASGVVITIKPSFPT